MILSQALNDLLPDSVIEAKYAGGKALGPAPLTGEAACGAVEREAIHKDFQLLDMVMKELGRQVKKPAWPLPIHSFPSASVSAPYSEHSSKPTEPACCSGCFPLCRQS